MKILIHGLNYAPERVGVGRYTGELGEWLAEWDHEARVVTAPPYYPEWKVGEGYSPRSYRREKIDGVEVPRCPLWIPENPSGSKRLVHLVSFALSSSPLPLAEHHRQAFPGAREERTIEVEVSTLDRVFERVELERPVLLKLDVQGYEAHVLRGGEETLRRADYVVLEASFKPMYEGEQTFMEMARMMEGYGFRFQRPVGWLSEPETGEILQMDALFTREG